MKSCLGILLVFGTFVSVVGGGALIWYLSNTAEFSRKNPAIATAPVAPPATHPATPPKAQPVPPRTPPKPIPQEIPRSTPKPAAPKPSSPSNPFGERQQP